MKLLFLEQKIAENKAILKKMRFKSQKDDFEDIPILIGSENYDPSILS